ncbi:MAG: SH3 domain-containing protein [Caldilineaceae bacterium]
MATVVAAGLNVRNGPGTNYGRISSVDEGDELMVVGQNSDCDWLLIFTPDGQPGLGLGQSPVHQAGRRLRRHRRSGSAPAPSSQASGSSGGGSAARTGQGCYTFQNQLGAELNITFTNRDTKWNTTFKVAPPRGENRQCFDPGRYTYTLDAPPPGIHQRRADRERRRQLRLPDLR